MPCDSYYNREAVERARLLAEREEALAELDARLVAGTATVKKKYDGSWSIEGWDAKSVDMADMCALADIAMHGTMAARSYLDQVTGGTADFAAIHAGAGGH